MPSAIRELTHLIAPPATPAEVAGADDWARAEADAGFAFPPDFKAVNAAYGSGAFDGFIIPLNPAASRRHMNLLTYSTDVELTLELYAEAVPAGPPCARVFPIAYTTNGDELFYCVGADGPTGLLLEGSRGSSHTRYDLSVVAFLAAVFRGTLRARTFPPNFPSPTPAFVPF